MRVHACTPMRCLLPQTARLPQFNRYQPAVSASDCPPSTIQQIPACSYCLRLPAFHSSTDTSLRFLPLTARLPQFNRYQPAVSASDCPPSTIQQTPACSYCLRLPAFHNSTDTSLQTLPQTARLPQFNRYQPAVSASDCPSSTIQQIPACSFCL